ncbi:unnamed protein product [Acanthoscelides obtectus]|uniref:Uncharacterized protein n=1 Tax=Acanthoscelides obtectus TaxID=200917 RepID=A0A9P0PT08_ACAOB|nr:unnamed protein product [Acanthoscelides obtectus]CAK1625962.1 Leucine-rich repeat-containing G-protein coupled receptor 6 [Acanthoscelides obtectus]
MLLRILILGILQLCFCDHATFKNTYIFIRRFGENSGTNLTVESAGSLNDFLSKEHPRSEHFHSIILKGQNVPTLHNGSLADLVILDTLSIEFSNVHEIQPGAFRNLTCSVMSLKGNNIKELRSDVLTGLSLKGLDLSQNGLSTISDSAFHQMQSLLTINLSHNSISTWNVNWFKNNDMLMQILIQNNTIKTLPEFSFSNLAGDLPIALVFSHNRISKIDTNAFRGIKTIIKLALDNNLIEDIGNSTLNGISIYTLRINNNMIKCLEGDLDNILGDFLLLPILKYSLGLHLP